MEKKYSLLLLLFSFVTFSQTLESLKKDTKKMYEATYVMDFETVLNYTHPKVLEMVTREQMIKVLNNSFENENFKVRLVNENPTFTFSEITKIEGKTLCLITYTNAMRMTFEKKITPENAEALLKSFKESDEYKTLIFEQERNSFFLEGKTTMIAVAEDSTKNEWKFVNYSKSNTLSKTIFGDETLQLLGF